MAPRNEFINKVISNSPNVIVGKKYNYKAIKKDGLWHIYFQDFEFEPWKLYCREYYPWETNNNPRSKIKVNWNEYNGANQHGTY